jgi:hypothetical protein
LGVGSASENNQQKSGYLWEKGPHRMNYIIKILEISDIFLSAYQNSDKLSRPGEGREAEFSNLFPFRKQRRRAL